MLGRLVLAPIDVVLAVEFAGKKILDPALDPAMDVKAYLESNFDPTHIKTLPGETPTRFRIRPMKRHWKETADSIDIPRERAGWYWRCGVTRLEGYQISDGSKIIDAPSPDNDDKPAPTEWLDKVDPQEAVLFGIFSMIKHISEAGLPLSKPSVRPSGPTDL